MKLFASMVIALGLVLFCLSEAGAADYSKQIYESEIDEMISFYENRLYLLDSEFAILSGVGRDAKRMVNYLYGKKNELIDEMIDKKMAVKPKKIRTFIVNKARMADVGLAYTK